MNLVTITTFHFAYGGGREVHTLDPALKGPEVTFCGLSSRGLVLVEPTADVVKNRDLCSICREETKERAKAGRIYY